MSKKWWMDVCPDGATMSFCSGMTPQASQYAWVTFSISGVVFCFDGRILIEASHEGKVDNIWFANGIREIIAVLGHIEYRLADAKLQTGVLTVEDDGQIVDRATSRARVDWGSTRMLPSMVPTPIVVAA
jgi:hypothetical protein